MTISIFDLFNIGVGPSSSHTTGPMRAARRFGLRLSREGLLDRTASVKVELFSSLALTGIGHGTDRALLLGLSGLEPESVDPDKIPEQIEAIRADQKILLAGVHEIDFDEAQHVVFRKREKLPLHPNGMRMTAFDATGESLEERVYYSVGGGFVVDEATAEDDQLVAGNREVPYPFRSGKELLALCQEHQLSIAELTRANERARRSEAQIDAGIAKIWAAMEACVARGCRTRGTLPGGLNVRRRAARLHEELAAGVPQDPQSDRLAVLDWVNLYALAVNEENAAGGRVVTAPTNGAAGILPAVMLYYQRHCQDSSLDGIQDFLLTAGSIGILFKENASISGAEVGCQGEVGVACSMAAAGLTQALGGTPHQVECAAEIGMEHNLGLTCDPVKGLVQIPCIERNAMGAVKAINASRLALRGDGEQHVTLDRVIATMMRTGRDMKAKYKETSKGGLAANVIEC